MEVHYFWLLDEEAQKYFSFQHHSGQEKLSDFYTKAFTSKDSQHARLFYVHEKTSPQKVVRVLKPSTWKGCVEKMQDSYVHRRPLPSLPAYNIRTNQELAFTTYFPNMLERSVPLKTNIPTYTNCTIKLIKKQVYVDN